jgi:hypothetical protein
MSMVSYSWSFPLPVLAVQHSVCIGWGSGSGSLKPDMHPTLLHLLFGLW